MTGFVRQRPIVSGVIAVILLLLIFSAFPIVPETKQAVIVRFGKPGAHSQPVAMPPNRLAPWARVSRTAFQASTRSCGSTSACRRWTCNRSSSCRPTSGGWMVDAFARYRIVDPLLMYIRSCERRSQRAVPQNILRFGGSQRARQAAVFAALLSPERQGVMDDVRTSLNESRRPSSASRSSTSASRS